jgi:bacterioferritin-associated ferredoxin
MITRCVCHDVTFVRLLQYAREHEGADLDALRRVFGCGSGCGLCVPYVRAMLRTGRTSFEPGAPPEEGRGGAPLPRQAPEEHG